METEVTLIGNLLNAKLTVSWRTNELATRESPLFLISDAVLFQVRVTRTFGRVYTAGNYGYNFVFVRFTRQRECDHLTYMIDFNSEELSIWGKAFTSDDGTWHLIHENKYEKFTFDVTVELVLQPSLFADLHKDTELTDFELRGEDGSVRMHRAVLAASSPVLRRMLSGAWRETAEGHVDVTGTSKVVLEHLKDFIYLHVLPESVENLKQLLLLSSYYIMPELERHCADRLVRFVKAYDLIEFAIKNNVKQLLFVVLECVKSGSISVTEIRETASMRASDASSTVISRDLNVVSEKKNNQMIDECALPTAT